MSNFPITRTALARLLVQLAIRALPEKDSWHLSPLFVADARLKALFEEYKVKRP